MLVNDVVMTDSNKETCYVKKRGFLSVRFLVARGKFRLLLEPNWLTILIATLRCLLFFH